MHKHLTLTQPTSPTNTHNNVRTQVTTKHLQQSTQTHNTHILHQITITHIKQTTQTK